MSRQFKEDYYKIGQVIDVSSNQFFIDNEDWLPPGANVDLTKYPDFEDYCMKNIPLVGGSVGFSSALTLYPNNVTMSESGKGLFVCNTGKAYHYDYEVDDNYATSITTGVTGHLYSCCLLESGVGLIVGQGGIVLRTTDFFKSVITSISVYSADMYVCHLWNNGKGVIITYASSSSSTRVYTTDDYGETFTLATQSSGQAPTYARSGSFLESGVGIVVGSDGYIGRTDDYGVTFRKVGSTPWANIASGAAPFLYSCSIATSGAVIVVGESGTVCRSSDFGHSFYEISIHETESLNTILYTVSLRDDGFAILACSAVTLSDGSTKSNSAYSYDFGRTWQLVTSTNIASTPLYGFILSTSYSMQTLTIKNSGRGLSGSFYSGNYYGSATKSLSSNVTVPNLIQDNSSTLVAVKAR